jgi:hypothetical protein
LRCADAQKQSSLYLDSDLSPERSTAVRGHLRTCDECTAIFERESALIDAAAELPELDPPDSIWDQVQARIAKEEVKDSLEWPLARWLRFHWRPVAGTAMVAAMAVALLLAQARSAPVLELSEVALVPPEITTTAVRMEESYRELRTEELAEADRQYLQTIAELREMLEGDRPRWDVRETARVDQQLAAFRKEAIGTRLAIESGTHSVQSRDQLYAGYRSEIGFLQSALAGDIDEEAR